MAPQSLFWTAHWFAFTARHRRYKLLCCVVERMHVLCMKYLLHWLTAQQLFSSNVIAKLSDVKRTSPVHFLFFSTQRNLSALHEVLCTWFEPWQDFGQPHPCAVPPWTRGLPPLMLLPDTWGKKWVVQLLKFFFYSLQAQNMSLLLWWWQ